MNMSKITKIAAAVISTLFLFAIIIFLAVGVVGCKTGDCDPIVRTTNMAAVVIGMENSQFAGSCPGAAYDAQRMRSLLYNYTSDIAYFSDATAKHDTVLSALKHAAEAELCVVFYSGHGGSDRFWNTGSEEEDGKDEYLCLYDTYMKDNEIWQIIQSAKGRVFLIFDCCHSQTMFRQPSFTMRYVVPLSATHHEDGDVSMLCWSGCPDDTYSYGSSSGGQFTNALIKHFSANKTYDYLWNEIESDTRLMEYEKVQRTIIGSGFDAKPIFR